MATATRWPIKQQSTQVYELVVCIHTCTLVVCIICILCIVGRRVVCVLSMPTS